MTKNDQRKGPKWLKTDQKRIKNGLIWYKGIKIENNVEMNKTIKNGQNDQKWQKMTENGRKGPKMTKNDQKKT